MTASRLLVVGPSWVGDMVMAQSLFKALKLSRSAVAIDVLAPAWSQPLLQRMPEVGKSLVMPLGHGRLDIASRWKMGKSLRGQYQQAILLPNSWKSALLPFAARIPRRTGWKGEARYGLLNDLRILDKQRLSMTVQRFVALAGDIATTDIPDIEPPRLRVQETDVLAAGADLQLELATDTGILGLCPGAEFGPAKCWPAASYASLARRYIRRGWSVWLFGSDKDSKICQQISSETSSACIDLSGRTSLGQAVDLLSAVTAVVSNDSGLMHVAAALDKPLVAVYGSTDPGFTPPLNPAHRIARLGLDCSPCFKRQCPLGHTHCLTRLEVDTVEASLEELLA